MEEVPIRSVQEAAVEAVLLTETLLKGEMDMSRLNGKEDYNETLCNDFVK